MNFFDIFLTLISFVAIWISSGLIVGTVSDLAHKIKVSPFIVSFLILGALTSSSEISVAVTSYYNQTLEISVGNLLGGIIVLFLLVIPMLAIVGNGVVIEKQYTRISLFFTLASLLLPAFFLIDSHLQLREAIMLLGAYIVSVTILFIKHKHKRKDSKKIKIDKNYIFVSLSKIVVGSIGLIWACDILINQVLTIAKVLEVSPFIISFLTLSIGTNFPEISIAIKSILSGKKDVAFGDYLGSASFNVVILSILAIVNNRITINENFISILIFTIVGLTLFYFFALSKSNFSRREGFIILCVYFIFLTTEIFISNNL